MTELEVNELEEIFSDPIKYYYYQDKYLVDLVVEKGGSEEYVKTGQLKGSFAEKLLQKEWFKKEFSSNNGGIGIKLSDLESYWPEHTLEFDISVANWGENPKKHQKDTWFQTSRSGYNLVLQVNLNQEHFKLYNSWLKPRWHGEGIFNCTCHPVSEKQITLGWIRLDIDFETDEVLIEEIQTDWLREINSLAKKLKNDNDNKHKKILQNESVDGQLADFWKYYNYMQPVSKIWDELFMSIALWFAKKELQIQNVWMHTFESCLLFKDQNYSKPPRSIYSKLPKRMGFVLSDKAPLFLMREIYLKRYFRKAKKDSVKWFKHEA
jgi:hypothetical protein